MADIFVQQFARFIIERERIRVAKEAGKPRPWTKDPILGKYRFCNVRREDDAVTQWLRTEYYPDFKDHEDLWFSAVVARLFNNPDALFDLGKVILPFKPEKMREILDKRKAEGEKNFNAAYIVSTNGIAMDKVEYVIYRILGPLWADRQRMRPTVNDTLFTYHQLLMSYDGLGSFIAAQIVADLKYLPPLVRAYDWETFAASGPGSRRGLNRWRGCTPNSPYKEGEWRADMNYVREETNKLLLKSDLFPSPLHAQDIQNCLCEYDKYERTRNGEGTPKQIYKEKN